MLLERRYPEIYKEAGFDIMSLDWDSYLISSRSEVAAVERNPDKAAKDGSAMPWFDIDPDTPTLHRPVKISDGMNGIYRSDRVSAQTLYYLMSTNNIPVDDTQKKNVTLESLLKTIDHWERQKERRLSDLFMQRMPSTSVLPAIFSSNISGKHQVFDDNPDAIRLLTEYIDALLERGELAHVVDAVDEGPILNETGDY